MSYSQTTGITVPRFSIITPARTLSDDLRRSVASTQVSSHLDVEHIIVSGSPIEPADLINTSAHNKQLSVLRQTGNVAEVLNAGIQASRGQIVSWLMPGDTLTSNALQRVSDRFCEPKTDVVCGNVILCDQAQRASSWLVPHFPIDTNCLLRWWNLRTSPSAVFMRRSACAQIGKFMHYHPPAVALNYWLRITSAGIKLDGLDAACAYIQPANCIEDWSSFVREKVDLYMELVLPWLEALPEHEQQYYWQDFTSYMLEHTGGCYPVQHKAAFAGAAMALRSHSALDDQQLVDYTTRGYHIPEIQGIYAQSLLDRGEHERAHQQFKRAIECYYPNYLNFPEHETWSCDQQQNAALTRRGTVSLATAKRILWVNTSRDASMVHGLCALNRLRTYHPDLHIVAACADRYVELFQEANVADEVWAIEDRFYCSEYTAYFAKRLAAARFDVAINSCFSRDASSDFLTIVSEAPHRIGFYGDTLRCNTRTLHNHNDGYTLLVPVTPQSSSEHSRLIELLSSLEVPHDSPQLSLPISPHSQAFTAEFFTRHALKPAQTVVILAQYKQEPRGLALFAPSLNNLVSRRGLSAIVLGDLDDRHKVQAQMSELGVEALNLCGHLKMSELTAILKHCRLVLGTDGVDSEIAASCSAPTVIVQGGGQWGRYALHSNTTALITQPTDCFGCNWKCHFTAPYCVKSLSAEFVDRAIQYNLDQPQSRARIIVPLKPSISTPRPMRLEGTLNSAQTELVALQ